ncbi:MAG: T9SS type A sorting domain-containing protein, partial [Bacteroidetes bacterium]|nr:T9SS type A sorting domain-containing protein [Bacteroidota bacterium]
HRSGLFSVTFSRDGYEPLTLDNVEFVNGEITELNVSLVSLEQVGFSGIVETSLEDPLENALVSISSDEFAYQLNTDAEGLFEKCNLIPDTYQVVTGKWGFKTVCVPALELGSSVGNYISMLEKGYYDDFQFNYGWSSSGDASHGLWVRVQPSETQLNGTICNPGSDAESDCNGFAYVTGNSNDSSPGTEDVDDGSAILRSPMMDLSTYLDPYLSFERWFYNGGGNDAPNDTLFIRMVPQSGAAVTLKKVVSDSTSSQWFGEEFRLLDYIPANSMVQFEMEAVDFPNGHLVEAGLDLFQVVDSGSTVSIDKISSSGISVRLYPNPAAGGQQLKYEITGTNNKTGFETEILDISGAVIQKFRTTGTQGMLTQKLPAGIYLIRFLFDSGDSKVQRLVITE